MEYFIVYLYLSLYDLLTKFGVVLIISLIPCVIIFAAGTASFCERHSYNNPVTLEKYKETWMYKFGKPYLLSVLVFFVFQSFVPSPKQLALIVGLPAIYNMATSEEAQKLPDNILRAVNGFLEESSKEEEDK